MPAGTGLVPRLWTATVKETGAPAAGAAGFEVMPVIRRSGRGLADGQGRPPVRLLLVSSSSGTVSVRSATAETLATCPGVPADGDVECGGGSGGEGGDRA